MVLLYSEVYTNKSFFINYAKSDSDSPLILSLISLNPAYVGPMVYLTKYIYT
jgi:hypothetical protein